MPPAITEWPIIGRKAPTWQPDRIGFLQIGCKPANGFFEFFYAKPFANLGTDIASAIARVRNRSVPLDLPPETPLDLHVQQGKLFVIIGLDPQWKWEFRPKGDAATCKKAANASVISHLTHVLDNGTEVDGHQDSSAPVSEKPARCGLLYFAVESPVEDINYNDGINFHVDLIQPPDPRQPAEPPKRLPLVIDPDIKHPGGTDP